MEKTTQISVGTSTHRDFFQRGREAAQMAKTQRPSSVPGLILALSDAGVHFKDFIEGVRLVMGDRLLIGLPAEPWLAQDAPSRETGAVVVLTSKTNAFFVTSHHTVLSRAEAGTTQLASSAHLHSASGLIVFGEGELIADRIFQRALVADLNPHTWAIGAALGLKSQSSVACENQFLHHGVAAVGIQSQQPWNAANVGLASFRNQPQFLEQGIKTAVRSAMRQNSAAGMAFGLLLLNGFKDLNSSSAHRSISQAMAGACPHMPWLGLTTAAHFVHHNDRWHPSSVETLTLVLVPS